MNRVFLSLVGLACVATFGDVSWAGTAAVSPDIATARKTLAEVDAEEAALEGRIGETRVELARLLSAFELYGRDPPPALLVSPGDARQAVRAMILIRAITPALEARARALSDQARALSLVRRKAAAASGELFAAESAIADRQVRLDSVTADADSLTPPEARSTGDAGREAVPHALLAPVSGTVTTAFGRRGPDGTPSHGLWYSARPGAPVTSPVAGLVDYAGRLAGWGQVLIIRGPGGCHMILSGLGAVSAVRGAQVWAGEKVGLTSDGGAGPSGLYFEYRPGAKPSDPAPLIARAAEAPGGLRRERL